MDIGGLWLLGVGGGLTRRFWAVLKKIVLGARKLLQGKGFCTAKSYEGLSEEEERATARPMRGPSLRSRMTVKNRQRQRLVYNEF
jgi:hypothetical protein